MHKKEMLVYFIIAFIGIIAGETSANVNVQQSYATLEALMGAMLTSFCYFTYTYFANTKLAERVRKLEALLQEKDKN